MLLAGNNYACRFLKRRTNYKQNFKELYLVDHRQYVDEKHRRHVDQSLQRENRQQHICRIFQQLTLEHERPDMKRSRKGKIKISLYTCIVCMLYLQSRRRTSITSLPT